MEGRKVEANRGERRRDEGKGRVRRRKEEKRMEANRGNGFSDEKYWK